MIDGRADEKKECEMKNLIKSRPEKYAAAINEI